MRRDALCCNGVARGDGRGPSGDRGVRRTQVRSRLTGWAARFVDPDALVVDDTGFPKDGTASPGVARMYCGALGKRGNCQIGVSGHAATDWASAALDWRLYLPKSWDDHTATDPDEAEQITARRARCVIPDHARFREKWRLALDMLDEVLTWGMPARPVIADAAYGDSIAFRAGLTDRGLTYVLAVSAATSVHPATAPPVPPTYSGFGRPPTRTDYPDKPVTAKTMIITTGRSAGRFVTWRRGSRHTASNPGAVMRSRFLALRVRPANRNITRGPDGSLPECWLLAERPTGAENPLAHRTRLPRTQRRPRPGPLRRPILARLAPPRHPHLHRPGNLHHAAPHPKSPCAGLTLYAVLRRLQHLLATWTGHCHTCHQPLPARTQPPHT